VDQRSTQLVPHDDGPAVDRIQLLVITGPDAGKSLAAPGTRCVIGTHDSADLVLTDPTVSRFHCVISARRIAR
jgi:pSer/pThr/pTyr-binding forkhead associated (FHA) protein